jgi:hypothetical protein
MKRLVSILAILLISTNALSERIKSSVHSLSLSMTAAPHVLRLTNGRVVYVDVQNKTTAQQLTQAQGLEIVLESDDKGNLISFVLGRAAAENISEVSHLEDTPEAFNPTPIKDFSEAQTIFERLNNNYQRVSQCYNRAHVWAYEEFKNHAKKTEKAWIFFTNSYLRKHRFIWWFHVAPLVKTLEGQEYVLDYRFSFGPSSIKEWTDLWVYTKNVCPVIEKYSSYSNNQENEDCYYIKTSMYYWQPWQIKALEDEGIQRSKFVEADIKWSYEEAF